MTAIAKMAIAKAPKVSAREFTLKSGAQLSILIYGNFRAILAILNDFCFAACVQHQNWAIVRA
jgi:hypothetical protein